MSATNKSMPSPGQAGLQDGRAAPSLGCPPALAGHLADEQRTNSAFAPRPNTNPDASACLLNVCLPVATCGQIYETGAT